MLLPPTGTEVGGRMEKLMVTKNILYNGEVEIDLNSFNHSYTKGGQSLSSVTAITGAINKPALIGWAVSECIDYLKERVRPGISFDEVDLVGLFQGAARAHTKSKDRSADIGLLVHDWVRKYVKGEEPEMPVNPQLQTSINNFLVWEKEHKVKFLASEQVIYSKKYNYCGTFDSNATVDGELTLIDMKTSSGVYDEMFAQLAGYEQARVEEFPQENYKKRGVLWISRNGDFDFVESRFPDTALRMFLGAREVHLAQRFYKEEYFKSRQK